MADKENVPEGGREQFLERRSSKSRLFKQVEVEEDEDHSPSSETSEATIVAPAGPENLTITPPEGSSPGADSPEETGSTLESQRSIESDKSSPTQLSHPKVKLMRSHALRDDASPPPDDPNGTSASPAATAITVTAPSDSVRTQDSLELPDPIPLRVKKRGKLEKSGSGSASGSFSDVSPVLSRDSSVETQYTDSTGINLEEFIANTLNKNAKDRIMLLKLEQDLTNFIKEDKHSHLKFPQMTSYHRMLVHRIAAFFGLDHNVDQSGKCVYVNRTANTRIPDFKFRDQIRDEGSGDDQPKKQILKRECASLDDSKDCYSPERMTMDGKKSKSFEERAEDYRRAKERIFSKEGVLLESPASNTSQSSPRSSKEDLRGPWAEPRQWSSTDSSGYGTDTSSKHKVSVTKAGSFGGMTVLMRDSKGHGRLSSKSGTADSLSSGNSSNIGSPMTRPPTIPSSPPPSSEFSESSESAASATSPLQQPLPQPQGPMSMGSVPFSADQNQLLWVASSVDSIPPGSMIINPQTGQPYCNPDGTYYRYQPQGPQSQATPPGTASLPPQSSVATYSATAPAPSYFPPYSVVSPGQNTYTSDSGTSDLSHNFSSLSVSPQSIEGHQEAVPGHPQQQQIYMMTTPGQDQSQQSYPHTQMQQIPYYGNTQQTMRFPPASVTYMGMPQQLPHHYPAGPSPVEAQQSSQPGQSCPVPPSPQENPTYPVPGMSGGYASYQFMSYPAGGEPYSQGMFSGSGNGGYPAVQPQTQQQTQQLTSPTTGLQPPPADVPVQQSQQQQQQQPFTAAPQYPAASVTYSPPSGSMCMYYSVPNGGPSSQVMAYPNPNPMSVIGQGSMYGSKTPPSQSAGGVTMTLGSGAGAAQVTPGGLGHSQFSMGQSLGNMTSAQYLTYPMYHGTQQMGQHQQQQQNPQQLPPYPQSLSAQNPSPGSCSPLRATLNLGLHATPSSPHSLGQYPQMAMPQGARPVKVMSLDQRGVHSVEGSKENNATSPNLQMQSPPSKSGIPRVQPITPPYRNPTPMNASDVRLLGPPLQQQFRPQIPLLFQPRHRYMGPGGSTNQSGMGKNVRSRRTYRNNSRDNNIARHNVTETQEPGGSSILEVFNLPSGIKRSEADSLLSDLTKHGIRLQYHPDAKNPNRSVSDCHIYALCDSDMTAQNVLANHKNPKYKLRKSHRSSGDLVGIEGLS